MPKNFIITCGTSQIEEDKLNKIIPFIRNMDRETARKLEEYIEGIKNESEIIKEEDEQEHFQKITNIPENDDSAPEEQVYCNLIFKVLSKYWDGNNGEIDKIIGSGQNPFGAEISTLFLLGKQFKDERRQDINPGMDFVNLLYSQTEDGAFCAGIIYRILCEKMNFPKSAIKTKLIPGVTKDPESPNDTLYNIIIGAADLCRRGPDNIFIVTGGYKYMIDIVGLLAQLINCPHYYMFESASQVINLTFIKKLLPDPRISKKIEEYLKEKLKLSEEDIPFLLFDSEKKLNIIKNMERDKFKENIDYGRKFD